MWINITSEIPSTFCWCKDVSTNFAKFFFPLLWRVLQTCMIRFSGIGLWKAAAGGKLMSGNSCCQSSNMGGASGACVLSAKTTGAQFGQNVKGYGWTHTSPTPGLLAQDPAQGRCLSWMLQCPPAKSQWFPFAFLCTSKSGYCCSGPPSKTHPEGGGASFSLPQTRIVLIMLLLLVFSFLWHLKESL